MSTKAAAKPGRPAPKSTVKTPGKDQIKPEKASTNVLEIVPGKFTESDWVSLLENDDTEDFIADIFDNIWSDASEQIEQIYIHRQLLPFTLMMTENALSSVIQWAFLERDDSKPADGNFWIEDDEPIPCAMDNWGEGVVPACREERPQSMEETQISDVERSLSAPLETQTPEYIEQIQRPLSNSPSHSLTRSDTETKQFHTIENIDQINEEEKSVKDDDDEKESSSEQKSSNHDILVIENNPPKLEPLIDPYYPIHVQTTNSSPYPIPATITAKRRRIAPKASSQLGSDAIASTTNITDTTTTKSMKKNESKFFDDQHIEDIISKAPAAAHSMLKSILNRPPGYRELELDDLGNVISIAKLDPDKIAPRSVHVKCDIIKPRKPTIEIRSPSKPSQLSKLSRSEPKFPSAKLVLPERSTEVRDLIHPVPGVLYEDSNLKKGDPRRYKTGASKYTNFYDETRPLKPIARRGDFTVLQTANELLRKTEDFNDDNNNQRDLQIPKLHRLARIPPIMSASSTSTT